MNINEFSNYLIALLIFLQVLTMVVFLALFSAYSNTGLLYATILMVLVNTAVFYGVKKINVYDAKGKQVNLGDVFGDVIGVVMITFIVSVVLLITGMFLSLRVASTKGYGKGGAVFLPVLSLASFYGALMIFKN